MCLTGSSKSTWYHNNFDSQLRKGRSRRQGLVASAVLKMSLVHPWVEFDPPSYSKMKKGYHKTVDYSAFPFQNEPINSAQDKINININKCR